MYRIAWYADDGELDNELQQRAHLQFGLLHGFTGERGRKGDVADPHLSGAWERHSLYSSCRPKVKSDAVRSRSGSRFARKSHESRAIQRVSMYIGSITPRVKHYSTTKNPLIALASNREHRHVSRDREHEVRLDLVDLICLLLIVRD